MSDSKKALIMAGGTGGHIFPGLAVADELCKRGWDIRWLGTADRMEAQLVPQHGYSIDFLDISGVRGHGIFRRLSAPIKILKSIIQAHQVIRQYSPDVVIGFGGFASGPGGVAAYLNRKPLFIHEQNAAAGLTNRLLSRISSRVYAAFEGAFQHSKKLKIVGNPVREQLLSLPHPQVRLNRDQAVNLRILVIGGSLGARILNQRLPACFALFSQSKSLEVIHQCGRDHLDETLSTYKQAHFHTVEVKPFIDNMSEAYQWADMVICRAGALTVSELAAIGLPAIFVPLPHAVDDHQTKNASVLSQQNAAKIVPQTELSADNLVEKIGQIARSRDVLIQHAENAQKIAKTHAAQIIADDCDSLLQPNTGKV